MNQILFKKPRESDFWESDREDVGVIDEKPSQSQRLLVAAIEFGTTYSAIAYSLRYDWTRTIAITPTDGKYPRYKSPTTLLLNPDKSYRKLGFGAEKEYESLVEENKHRFYFFFRQFTSILKPNHTDSKVCDNAFHYSTPTLVIYIYKSIFRDDLSPNQNGAIFFKNPQNYVLLTE